MADKKGDKKAGGPDDIMSPGALRPILAQAKRGSAASCVIAMTKDKDGVMLADKRKKPKKLVTDLKKLAGGADIELDMTSIRFGRAMVDPDKDAALLTIMVNKDASGAMRPKILEVLKKAGFTKLEIIVDAGLESESEDDDAAPATAAAASDTQGADATSAPDKAEPSPAAAAPQAPDQAAAAPDAPPEAPPAPSGPSPELAALARKLTDLVKGLPKLIESDPSRRDALTALAAKATASLKEGDEAKAGELIDALQEAIDKAPAPGAPQISPAALAKARTAWVATRNKVETDIGKLRASFLDAFKGHEQVAALEAGFEKRVETVLSGLDEELAHTLDDVAKAADPAQHAQLVGEARKIIVRYQKFLASDPTVAEIDENPLVPLSLQKTLTATLTVLSKAIV